ncbi:unnamed protein product [Bursaphelenchus xylophilus]|uniref:Protein-lysine N-methyltransferase BXYJ_LOCUS3081 n=1 Tax=Bursaphelenchus xylophilus TaxID=6326 RepID=A0A1I7SFF4_BURXY|nr:unnamed protein product [Bursaphelenchus xylophilus]CAG9092730.1 unnamed protein product [Bursaphelenchus xylophilus]
MPSTSENPLNVDFECSKLGTKEYWDQRYAQDLETFRDCGEEGEIWFGKTAENRIIKFVRENVPQSAAILDLGCANGSILRKLFYKGYRNLFGVDYSETAIRLAKECVENDEDVDSPESFQFETVDLTSPDALPDSLKAKFDSLMDKGTWDAISLGSNPSDLIHRYVQCLSALFNDETEGNQYFVIISCNFTVEELTDFFTKDGRFEVHAELPNTNTFCFGGKVGKTTSGMAFKRIR